MALNSKERQQLKAKAHKLKPIVFIGNNGLSETVQMEIDRGLQDHKLIKIRIQTQDRLLRRAMFDEICLTHQAEPVQMIGTIATIFRDTTEG